MLTHVIHTCAKFQQNASTHIRVTRNRCQRTTDGRTDNHETQSAEALKLAMISIYG